MSIAANSQGPGMLRYNAGAQEHRCMIQERRMGEWKTIYDDEVARSGAARNATVP